MEAGRWGVPAPDSGHWLPMSSKGDIGAGQSRDLREVWEPRPKGIDYPPETGKKGHLGEMPSIICSLRVLDHTYYK